MSSSRSLVRNLPPARPLAPLPPSSSSSLPLSLAISPSLFSVHPPIPSLSPPPFLPPLPAPTASHLPFSSSSPSTTPARLRGRPSPPPAATTSPSLSLPSYPRNDRLPFARSLSRFLPPARASPSPSRLSLSLPLLRRRRQPASAADRLPLPPSDLPSLPAQRPLLSHRRSDCHKYPATSFSRDRTSRLLHCRRSTLLFSVTLKKVLAPYSGTTASTVATDACLLPTAITKPAVH